MVVIDPVLVLHVGVLLVGNHTEVRISVLVHSDRHFGGDILREVGRILHILEDKALLHLTDVFFLDDSHEVGECAVDGVLFESVTLLDALAHEAFTTLSG